jgi:YD repeat-containing protein
VAGTTTYGYDTADRLITVLAPSGSSLPNETFAYDAAGNQTGAGQHYDAANRLLSDSTYDYAYDNEGNQTTKTERATGKATTYAWNALHELTSATLPDGTVVSYRYDALGRRVEVSTPSGTTRYVNLGANVVAEYDGANALRASYLTTIGTGGLPGMPLEVTTGSTSNYPLLDAVGSVTALTDASGAISSAFAYTAYGTPVGGLEHRVRNRRFEVGANRFCT